mgnify:CR=1 FL=1
MEIDIIPALLLYFSGIVTYGFSLRIFKVYTKSVFYKMLYINSLSILKYADNLAQDLINNSPGNENSQSTTAKAFEHWRLLSLYSLRVCVPDSVWQEMGTLEWNQAMRILKLLENEKEQA